MYLLILLAALLVGCGAQLDMLSTTEKDQFYSVKLYPASELATRLAQGAESGLEPSASSDTTQLTGSELSDGQILKPGAQLFLSCSSSSDSLDFKSVIVSLTQSGLSIKSLAYVETGASLPLGYDQLLSQARFLPELDGALLSLEIPPGLADGRYGISVELLDAQSSKFLKEYTVFALASDLEINSVEVCPSLVSPGSIAVLEMDLMVGPSLQDVLAATEVLPLAVEASPEVGDLSSPIAIDPAVFPSPEILATAAPLTDSTQVTIDPYVVWSYGGSTLASGKLSEGLSQVLWQSPSQDGLYDIEVDVYPYAPDSAAGENSFAFASSLRRVVQAHVASPDPDPSDPFAENGDFFSVLHLNGSIADQGYRQGDRSVQVSGQAKVLTIGNTYGYQIDQDFTCQLSGFSLPTRAGAIDGFTLMARLAMEDQRDLVVWRSHSDYGLSLSLNLDESGSYEFVVSTASLAVRSRSGIFPSEGLQELTLSYVPEANGFRLLWYLDGRFVSAERFAYSFPSIDGQAGTTLIGGADSASFILDELGVYSQRGELANATWSGQFARQSAKLYGDQVVYAEGFDAPPPQGPLSLSGDYSIGDSNVALSADSRLQLSLATVERQALMVEIAFAQPDYSQGSTLSLRGQKGETLCTIDSLGRVYANGKLLYTAPGIGGSSGFKLCLERRGGAIYLALSKRRVRLFSYPTEATGPSLSLAPIDRLELASILVRGLTDGDYLSRAPSDPRGNV